MELEFLSWVLPFLDPVARALGIEIPYLQEGRRVWSAVTVGLPFLAGGCLLAGFGLRVFFGRLRGRFARWPALVGPVSGGAGLAGALAGWLTVAAAPFALLHTLALVLGGLAWLVGHWLAGIRWTGSRL